MENSLHAGGTLSLSESDKDVLVRSTEQLLEQTEGSSQEHLNTGPPTQKPSAGLILITENPSMRAFGAREDGDTDAHGQTEAASACTPLLVYESFPSW